MNETEYLLMFTQALPQYRADILVHAVLNNFPTEAKHFEDSLCSILLCRLSLYYWSLQYPHTTTIDYHRAVDLAKPALKALSNIDLFLDDSTGFEEGLEAIEGLSYAKKSQKQKHRKKSVIRTSMAIDPKPFQQLGIPVPLTRSDAIEQAGHILQEQKKILQVRLVFHVRHLSCPSKTVIL